MRNNECIHKILLFPDFQYYTFIQQCTTTLQLSPLGSLIYKCCRYLSNALVFSCCPLSFKVEAGSQEGVQRVVQAQQTAPVLLDTY